MTNTIPRAFTNLNARTAPSNISGKLDALSLLGIKNTLGLLNITKKHLDTLDIF
jgi:acetylglutamate kinase